MRRYQVEWFEDIDRSGWDEKNRPGWQALQERLEHPDAVGVISYSLLSQVAYCGGCGQRMIGSFEYNRRA